MVLRRLVWVVGLACGVLAVLTTVKYYDLASGRMIVDFFSTDDGALQRQLTRRTGGAALFYTFACLASFIFAFSSPAGVGRTARGPLSPAASGTRPQQ